MRSSVLPGIALAMVPFLAATAQESLCNPCVDPPVNGIGRDQWLDFNRRSSTTTITAEEMRNLGILSVADMINQLPGSAGRSPFDDPVSLGDADAFPVEYAPVFRAAAGHLQSLAYVPGEYNARLIVCPEGSCTLLIFPAELGDASAMTVRECPVGYCATMIYSLPEERVLAIRD